MDFTIEELTMNAWPSIQTMFFEGWILRMANGYTKRSNSINPIYTFDNDIHRKIKYCEKIYQENNLPTIFKILECNEHKEIDQILEKLNYEKIDIVSLQICTDIRQKDYIQNKAIVNNKFSADWKNCFYECYEIDDLKRIETIEIMLNNIKLDLITVYIKENGILIGCGYGVIEKGYVGLFDIIVKKEYRGKSYGKEIVKTILFKASEQGAEKAHLMVLDNNIIAKNLYAKLGFKEKYKCWFRKKI